MPVRTAQPGGQVNIWGFVQKPGRYEVPSSTDLIQLISYAGGPVQYAKLDEVKLTRWILYDTTGKRQKSEIRSRKTETRGQKSEVRSQKTEISNR
ncbi:MAG: hypothetical protein FJ217_16365 [Ignavibacteria bacterium]|nr:hypothetical protein [Ignavibacteria bacterium]